MGSFRMAREHAGEAGSSSWIALPWHRYPLRAALTTTIDNPQPTLARLHSGSGRGFCADGDSLGPTGFLHLSAQAPADRTQPRRPRRNAECSPAPQITPPAALGDALRDTSCTGTSRSRGPAPPRAPGQEKSHTDKSQQPLCPGQATFHVRRSTLQLPDTCPE